MLMISMGNPVDITWQALDLAWWGDGVSGMVIWLSRTGSRCQVHAAMHSEKQ